VATEAWDEGLGFRLGWGICRCGRTPAAPLYCGFITCGDAPAPRLGQVSVIPARIPGADARRSGDAPCASGVVCGATAGMIQTLRVERRVTSLNRLLRYAVEHCRFVRYAFSQEQNVSERRHKNASIYYAAASRWSGRGSRFDESGRRVRLCNMKWTWISP
jgi:hypothetical protein